MNRVINIIKQWGFQEGVDGHYYKFITPDSRVSFDITEDVVIITFRIITGGDGNERNRVEGRTVLLSCRIDAISTILALKGILKDTIIRLIIDAHNEYLFNE